MNQSPPPPSAVCSPVALRLGARGSPSARWQAEWVAAQLEAAGVRVELVPIVTSGDRHQAPLGAVGGQGLFTKEIQRELLAGRIDLAVHSLKDLPTEGPPELCLAAAPRRASVADVLVSPKYPSLDALPAGAVVGTGSLRRRAQLLHVRRDLQVRDVRGNVDTRLRKLETGDFDAMILAEAGLQRLGLTQWIAEVLPTSIVMPAVGQGALGLETRRDDRTTRDAIGPLDDAATHAAVLAERAMLAALHGGCLTPIAAWGRCEGERLLLTGRVLSVDGTAKIEATRDASPTEAQQLGREVADALLDQGAAALIETARK